MFNAWGLEILFYLKYSQMSLIICLETLRLQCIDYAVYHFVYNLCLRESCDVMSKDWHYIRIFGHSAIYSFNSYSPT